MILFRAPRKIYTSRRAAAAGAIVLVSVLFFALLKDRILAAVLPQPIFVKSAGNFVAGKTEVQLQSFISGDIYYTTDGSTPTVQSLRYESPLSVEDSTLLRFAIFHGKKQFTHTQDYDLFVGPSHTVPVLSLTTEPENLWDEETGIYVQGNHENFMQTGEEWERRANIRFYQPNGQLEFSQPVAIRLQGKNMRSMPQKSFRVYIADEDGRKKTLQYPLFGNEGNREYESFILRNGGGDTSIAMLRDPLAARIVRENSEVTTQLTRPVVVYVNGQYWGLYFLYERYDPTFFAQRYQMKRKALSVVEVPLSSSENRGDVIPEEKGAEEAAEAYNQLLAEARRCVGCLDYFSLSEQADGDNLLDYLAFELLFSNVDWPFNNSKAWRYESDIQSPEAFVLPELDGRFRWLLLDLDAGLGAGNHTEEEMRESAQGNTYTKLHDERFPFRNLFYDATFKKKYMSRVRELVRGGARPEATTKILEEMAAEIRPEMPRHIERWGQEASREGNTTVKSMEDWERNLDLLELYLETRPEAFLQRTENFLEQRE